MFRVTGRVIDKKARGIPRLRVEAWDKDLVFDDLLGAAKTDHRGAFLIECDESQFKELFHDRYPDLFFRIFQGDALVRSTADAVQWNVREAQTEVVITVDLPARPLRGNRRA